MENPIYNPTSELQMGFLFHGFLKSYDKPAYFIGSVCFHRQAEPLGLSLYFVCCVLKIGMPVTICNSCVFEIENGFYDFIDVSFS